MTSSRRPGHRHSIGISRRELLQVGYTGLLGISLPALLTQQAQSAAAKRAQGEKPRKAKSVILVFLTGAPSHIDTFDLKPDAPSEVRGEFKPIATKVPGLLVGEHLPRLAAHADKYAVVRSLAHRENNHLMATHHLLTGHLQPGRFSTRWRRAMTGRVIRLAWTTSSRATMASRPASICRRSLWKAR